VQLLHTLSGTSGGSPCPVLRRTVTLSVLLALSQLLLTVNVGGSSFSSQGSRPDRLMAGLAAASEACSSSKVTDCVLIRMQVGSRGMRLSVCKCNVSSRTWLSHILEHYATKQSREGTLCHDECASRVHKLNTAPMETDRRAHTAVCTQRVLHYLHVVCVEEGAQAACKGLRAQQGVVQTHNLSTLQGGPRQAGLYMSSSKHMQVFKAAPCATCQG
jgi:hypothetical protein